jgi:hypothetical protein
MYLFSSVILPSFLSLTGPLSIFSKIVRKKYLNIYTDISFSPSILLPFSTPAPLSCSLLTLTHPHPLYALIPTLTTSSPLPPHPLFLPPFI